jgi:hypothetical protein
MPAREALEGGRRWRRWYVAGAREADDDDGCEQA